MRVFHVDSHHSISNCCVVLFGVGLIGSAIVNSLLKRAKTSSPNLSWCWNNSLEQQKNIVDMMAYLDVSLPCELHVVWCAGKGGFGASKDEIAPEFASYMNVVNFVKEMAKRNKHRLSFHLFSSGGGLFEGQSCIDFHTPKAPLRPYGELKREQEIELEKLPQIITKHIYRPSSVYGVANPGARLGLISCMIKNALAHKVTPVFGNINTLRDYVFTEDIGFFVSANIIESKKHSVLQIHHLAHGKPTSIFEVKRTIESVLRRKIYLQYFKTNLNNTLNITYNPNAIPRALNRTDLRVGVKKIHLNFVK